MIIAEELELPLEKVQRHAGRRSARAALQPAHRRLEHHASRCTRRSGSPPRSPSARCWRPRPSCSAYDGRARSSPRAASITAPDGRAGTYAELAPLAAARTTTGRSRSSSKPTSAARGHRHAARTAIDALRRRSPARKQFTMDLEVPGALPTMVCRPPTLNGTPRRCATCRRSWRCRASPTSSLVDTGVAVRAADLRPVHRRRPRDAASSGTPGPVEGESDDTSWPSSRRRAAAGACPRCRCSPRPSTRVSTFLFRSNAALETNSAIADVRADRAEIWAGLKSPIVAQQNDRQGARPAAARR